MYTYVRGLHNTCYSFQRILVARLKSILRKGWDIDHAQLFDLDNFIFDLNSSSQNTVIVYKTNQGDLLSQYR